MSFTAQQSALFKVQKYHARMAREIRAELKRWPTVFGPCETKSKNREANQHQRFVNAITPFLMPV